MERRTLTCTTFSKYGSETWTLPEFLAEIRKAAEGIPEEWRPAAIVEFEDGGYDESAHLTISYTRPQTDEEVAETQARESAWRAVQSRQREAAERTQYERLKAKFEASPQPRDEPPHGKPDEDAGQDQP